jgi:N6-adenosine-specific RNA methylase IME4/ParB-like chromosome segregation protein Spo0J
LSKAGDLLGSPALCFFGGNRAGSAFTVSALITGQLAEATAVGKTVTIDLTKIVVPSDRLRALRPDHVKQLANSMRLDGLLQPIKVRSNPPGPYSLVFGWHRLEAAKLLGWTTIDAVVAEGLTADAALLDEIDENLCRAELTPAERALHLAERKRIFERLHPEIRHGGDRKSVEAKSKSQNENLKAFADDTAGKTGKGRSTVARDLTRANKVAVLADIIGTSLDHGAEIDALARLPADEQRDLADRAKSGERVSARTRIKQVARRERERQLGAKQVALPNKQYGVIVSDPEWDDDVWSRETGMDRHAANHYPTSDVETIKSRPVANIAAKDCILFLWSTNQHLRIAMSVLEAWGFTYKSHYIWDKQQIGMGRWNRSRHEVLLVGTRGDPPCPAPGQQWESIISAPKGEHSSKPDGFLQMIETYFPTLPKIELNRRGPPRLGWDAWGLEAQPMEEAAAGIAATLGSPTLELTQTTTNIDGGIPEFLRRY